MFIFINKKRELNSTIVTNKHNNNPLNIRRFPGVRKQREHFWGSKKKSGQKGQKKKIGQINWLKRDIYKLDSEPI